MLSHSEHLIEDLHSLARWEVEEQHLKHIPFSLRKAFLSSRSLFLNVLHFFKGWGLLCSGQFLLGSSLFVDTFVLCTEMDLLILKFFIPDLSGFVGVVALL